jgi:UDP-N-acetylglucosamine acyltransferase
LGFKRETIDGLKKAFRIIWRDNNRFSEGIDQVKQEMEPFPELEMLLDFLDGSKRGVLR